MDVFSGRRILWVGCGFERCLGFRVFIVERNFPEGLFTPFNIYEYLEASIKDPVDGRCPPTRLRILLDNAGSQEFTRRYDVSTGYVGE